MHGASAHMNGGCGAHAPHAQQVHAAAEELTQGRLANSPHGGLCVEPAWWRWRGSMLGIIGWEVQTVIMTQTNAWRLGTIDHPLVPRDGVFSRGACLTDRGRTGGLCPARSPVDPFPSCFLSRRYTMRSGPAQLVADRGTSRARTKTAQHR